MELIHKLLLCMWNMAIYRDKEEDNEKRNETRRGDIHQFRKRHRTILEQEKLQLEFENF